MKKKKILVAMGLAVCASCFAQDDMTITLASGKKVYHLEDIKSMTFDGNNLKVEGEKLSINVKAGGNAIEIHGYDSREHYTLALFNIAGEKVLGFDNWRGAPVDISSLPKGIYVFTINNTTLKFRK